MKKTLLTLLLFVVAALYSLSVQAQEIKSLTSENFYTEIKEGYVLVDFWAEWCPPCRKLAPVLDEVAKDFDGKIKFTKLNVDIARDIAMSYSVRSIPMLVLFKDGKAVATWLGYQDKATLSSNLEKSIE